MVREYLSTYGQWCGQQPNSSKRLNKNKEGTGEGSGNKITRGKGWRTIQSDFRKSESIGSLRNVNKIKNTNIVIKIKNTNTVIKIKANT